MSFLNKIFNTVRLAGDLVDHGNSTTVYDQSTQTIGSGNETVDVDTVTTEGIDFGEASQVDIVESFLLQYPVGRLKTTVVGSGSVTLPGDSAGLHVIKLREPGDGSSVEDSRVFDDTTEWDPAENHQLKVYLNNITIDNDTNARISVKVSDTPDGDDFAGDDFLLGQLRGNGDVLAGTGENGTTGTTSDTSQANAFAAALEYIKLSWDGSTLTVEASDGSTTVTVSDSSNYPSGENLFLTINVEDATGSSANNADADVTAIEQVA